jgi:alkaline phosphatase D
LSIGIPGGAKVYNMDQWSGYLANRRRLLSAIETHGAGRTVTVSGDAHRHYAGDLVQDEGDGKVVASEFQTTSISSGDDGQGDDDFRAVQARADNPHLKATVDRRGYLLCDVDRAAWHADLKIVDRVSTPGGKLDICPPCPRTRQAGIAACLIKAFDDKAGRVVLSVMDHERNHAR